MWVFGDYGLVMPALIDDDLRNRDDFEEYSEDGKFDFQVRGRVLEHLRYFQDTFMEEGTYHRDILATPDHDYNYRFYTTQEAFAQALARSVMAIDYRKFKPSSERYEWGKQYHRVLNNIWSDVGELNTPGDIWGPWSPENPKGYGKANRYSTGYGRGIGSSFGNVEFGDEGNTYEEDFPDSIFDETLSQSSRRERLIEEMDSLNISMNDWPENLSPSEFELLKPELKKAFTKKQIKAMRTRNRKAFFVL